uniref:BACK domain-containing protein n=1 Tax=Strongyloides venezuelensis TaxID=75913 RepID=A0A0K0FQD2_STRVS
MAPLVVTNRLTRNFAKKLKLRSEYMPEENKITFLWQHVPALWLEELLDELAENHDSLSAVAIFDYLDKKISDTMKLEPDLDNLINCLELNVEIRKTLTVIFYIQLLPFKLKEKLCENRTLPSYDKITLNTIPLSVFKTLPSHIQDKLVVNNRPLVTVGYHGSRCITKRYLDTFFTIKNTHVVKQPARIHVDPAASLSLTCYSFLMEVQLNPLTIKKNIAHDNLEIDKFGCSYGFNFN